jgi:succinate dehydrogenase / fumarate reductase, cytochrome b subunit
MKGIRLVSREGSDMVYKTELISNGQVWRPMAVGMWAWWLQRVTGLGLAGYLLLHVFLMGTSILRGPSAFDSLLALLMGSKLFMLLDLALLAAVLIHGFNGIRLILFDLGLGIPHQKKVFWVGMGVACLFFLVALVRMGPEIIK